MSRSPSQCELAVMYHTLMNKREAAARANGVPLPPQETLQQFKHEFKQHYNSLIGFDSPAAVFREESIESPPVVIRGTGAKTTGSSSVQSDIGRRNTLNKPQIVPIRLETRFTAEGEAVGAMNSNSSTLEIIDSLNKNNNDNKY